MLQIIYTTVFRIEQLNNLTLHVRFINSENRGVHIACIYVVKSTPESAKKKKTQKTQQQQKKQKKTRKKTVFFSSSTI